MFGPKTVLLLVLAVALSRGSVPESDDANSVDHREGKAVDVSEQNVTAGKSLEDEFLDDLTNQCTKEMTLTCVRRNLYTYVGKSLDMKDLKITESLVFEKSDRERIDDARSDRAMKLDEEEKEEGDEKIVGEGEEGKNTFEDVLYEKGARFLMSHDLSIQLPKTFFDGATLKFSPKSLEDDGVLIKLEMPKAPAEEKSLEEGEKGRLFFHHKHKHFKKRLIMGFFALLLVIKLIKIKLLYLLPIILGVGTVKKLILKALIFIFPAFASIFKYCAGHKTHHHHTVAYHHLPVEPSIFDDWGPGPGGPVYHRRNEHTANGGYLSETAPEYYHYPPPPQKGYHPFLDDDRINRNVVVSEPPQFQYPPHPNANPRPPPKLSGFSKPSYSRNPPSHHPPQNPTRFNQPSAVHNVPPPPRVVSPPHAPVQQQVASVPAVHLVPAQQVHIATAGGNQKVYSPGVEEAVVRSQITLQQQQTALQQQQQALQQQTLLHQQALALQRQQQLQREQALLLQQQRLAAMTTKNPATAAATTPAPRVYDSFYSPILHKIDNVFAQMSFTEEGCRERLVCSMYKNPTRFSPHSNLISAELSRI
ncbi:hypothetical protein J437_LFUL011359 [Ladona fulva]|uniref:Uncharacterized protein n=1 Tax=Ladona fulva TaxID=123851 RepID=A0A8K0P053_LADFU|nr:hypothetical protein J437_LFUL011359 [Ladona fulva]